MIKDQETDISLDEHIAFLTELLLSANPDIDRPGVRGALGEAWLEQHARQNTENSLTLAIRYLTEASESAPGHEDRLRWWYLLAEGLHESGLKHRSLDDFDRAANWQSRLFDEVPPDDDGRDALVVASAELAWARFRLLRYGVEADDITIRHEVDRLLKTLTTHTVSGCDPDAVHVTQTHLGLGYLARFDVSGQRGDLDEGIAMSAAAVPHLPPDADLVSIARVELTDAYRTRGELDGDVASLDLAILTSETGMAMIDAHEFGWDSLHTSLARAYQSRWEQGEDPVDLDRAIECWRVLLSDDPDQVVAEECGNLLRARSELTNDPADITEAVAMLEFVARTASDDEDLWGHWFDLGHAYHRQAQLVDMPERLDAAVNCMDRAIESGEFDQSVLLTMHTARLVVVGEAFSAQRRAPDAPPLRATSRIRQILADSTAVFERFGDAPLEQRVGLASILAQAHLWEIRYDAGYFDTAEVLRLAGYARQHPDPPAGWAATIDLLCGVAEYVRSLSETGGTGEAGLSLLVDVLRRPDLNESARVAVERILAVMLQGRTSLIGDKRGQGAAIEMISRVTQPETDEEIESELMRIAFSVIQQTCRSDAEVAALIRPMDALLASLSPSARADKGFISLMTLVSHLGAVIEGREETPIELTLPDSPSAADPDPYLMTLAQNGMTRYHHALDRDDIVDLRVCGEYLNKLADFAIVGGPTRFVICRVAGWVWLAVARRDGTDVAAARLAAHWHEELLRSMRDLQDPDWASVARGLGESLRLAGDHDLARTRELGRSALRGHGVRVLLQSGTDYAIAAARAAAADTAVVAGWCLTDGAYDEVLSVLDAGRGLVLQATAASRDIADQLAANGHPELAAEWSLTGGLGSDRINGKPLGPALAASEASDDLRSRALDTLGFTGTERPRLSFFEDVPVDDVQRALAELDADALIYLIPSSDNIAGQAVVVLTSGLIDPIPMPRLVIDEGSPVRRWIESSPGARDAGPVTSSEAEVGASLDDVCRWAWTACVEQLVTYARRWILNRPARIVLVPMGVLGLVPWHAAYVSKGSQRRYAIHELVFSYAVSARMLCATAHHSIRPIESALVVGDPNGNLAFAGVEASAVHHSFYPDATYLGRSTGFAAVPPATPAAVLDWLAGASGPSMLHLACHGAVDPQFPADAHLILDGGERLAARTLVEVSRLAPLAIDLVFLAACTTNAMGDDYDEAFSLATAFLAAGAHTVFGSLWPVPDNETSLLMFMVHHYLNVDACAPMDALHRAQLWMLDPDRMPPAEMPDDLARFCFGPGPARPVAWAGFTHLGR